MMSGPISDPEAKDEEGVNKTEGAWRKKISKEDIGKWLPRVLSPYRSLQMRPVFPEHSVIDASSNWQLGKIRNRSMTALHIRY